MCKKEEYNNIEVKYCISCLHLGIFKLEDSELEYCGRCGDAELDVIHIEEWEKLYQDMYGNKYIEANKQLEE